MENLKEFIYFKRRELLTVAEKKEIVKEQLKFTIFNGMWAASIVTAITIYFKKNEEVESLINVGFSIFASVCLCYFIAGSVLGLIIFGMIQKKLRKITKEIKVAQKELHVIHQKELSMNE